MLTRRACITLAAGTLLGWSAYAGTRVDPAALLNSMYLATGGKAWDKLAGVELRGAYAQGGLTGTFEETVDLRKGRDVLAFDLGVLRGKQGVQPDFQWEADQTGLATIQDSPDARADAVTQSYQDRNGWFHPGADAPWAYVGRKSQAQRTYDLVRVVPEGGRPLVLWLDSATHVLDRMVQRDALQREVTTSFSDYRRVDGVLWPFSVRISKGHRPSDTVETATDVRFVPSVADVDFGPPHLKVSDARLLADAPAVTIPFAISDGYIVVSASLDGSPSFPFVLDSGGSNFITKAVAKRLGASASGTLAISGVGAQQMSGQITQIGRFQMGPVEISDQPFVVADAPAWPTSRGPTAGFIGCELLRRFVTRIDYHRQQLTLYQPNSVPDPPPGSQALRLHFDGCLPVVEASVDETSGSFGVDTGANGALTLFEAFYAAHRFPVELPGLKMLGTGLGGSTQALLTRVAELSLGDFTLSRPVTKLSFARQGAFASRLAGGSLGFGVLRRFILTFDYERRVLYLERSPDFRAEMPQSYSGVRLEKDDARIVHVLRVDSDSPAAGAGLEAGDELVAVDHVPVLDKSFFEIQETLDRSPGTKIRLDFTRSGVLRHGALTLRKLLPFQGPPHAYVGRP